jgi:hypothetical protein
MVPSLLLQYPVSNSFLAAVRPDPREDMPVSTAVAAVRHGLVIELLMRMRCLT